MDDTQLRKGILQLKDNVFMIFGSSGFINDGEWVIYAPLGVYEEVEKTSPSQEIIEVINGDIDNGNFDIIDHIKVLPRTAVRLYLEGVITKSMIYKATVEERKITFSAIDVQTSIGKKSFPIVVVPEFYCYLTTVDSDGNIV